MMAIEFLTKIFEDHKDDEAFIWRDNRCSYRQLLDCIFYWRETISTKGIQPGTVVALEGNHSPNAISILLALIERACIIVPLIRGETNENAQRVKIVQGEVLISVDERDEVEIVRMQGVADHDLYQRLRRMNHPGLILFSSGSTGEPKAMVHDILNILDKHKSPRLKLRILSFLLFNHIGGLDTVLYALSNGGCLVISHDTSVDGIMGTIEKYQVDTLPTSPTFIGLILLSGSYKRFDLSSLKIVSYGTEVMPESLLKRFHKTFPKIRLLQKYGMSEVGILRSQSPRSDSLWVKLGGEGFQTRVVNGVLQIKAESTFLGYLNYPTLAGEDGWFNTGDAVEVNGEYIKILGRQCGVINVGGEKVYPAEIENILLEMDNIQDVTVWGEPNSIMGQIVVARVRLLESEDFLALKRRMREFCKDRLARYKIPVKLEIDNHSQINHHLKKMRRLNSSPAK